MFVKFARSYFSKNAVQYPARQVVEVPDDEFVKGKDGKYVLPSGAVVVSLPKDTELPKPDAPVPGFGAISEKEQRLADLEQAASEPPAEPKAKPAEKK